MMNHNGMDDTDRSGNDAVPPPLRSALRSSSFQSSTFASSSSSSHKSDKRQRSYQYKYFFVMVGPLSFINHSCKKHENVNSFVYIPKTDADDDSDGSVVQQRGMWRIASVDKNVKKGKELLVSYSDEYTKHTCMLCMLSKHKKSSVASPNSTCLIRDDSHVRKN
jgi:hypothetical protein